MHILELDSYNLSDTVKFHDRLNPRLWNSAEHLRPDVAAKLMEIARDFQEFMGVPDLDVVDITISGSNAAYNYTGSSDIDLHLVINIPKVAHDEVYRELFNAKKYEYNDIHNIRIGGADVELYAQDSEQPHHSQGIYSLLNQDWISVPRRRRSTIDDVSTRSKYEDLAARVDSTIKTQDRERMVSLMAKIKTMRQTGLEKEGEFGSDNLAFKLLRNNGYIKRLIDARNAARDAELSLAELARPRKAVTYGFTTESPDGVNPSTKMFLENEPRDHETTVQEFIAHVIDRLGIDPVPEIVLHSDPDWSKQNHSFGRYNADTHALEVNLADRHVMDILRTVAHELVHCRQNQSKPLPDHAGATGSAWENDANARAGVIMRDYAESNPEKFTESASGYIPRNRKEARDPRFSMALTQDIRPGQVGREANKLGLKTDANGKPALLMKSANALRESKNNLSEIDRRGVLKAIGAGAAAAAVPSVAKAGPFVDVAALEKSDPEQVQKVWVPRYQELTARCQDLLRRLIAAAGPKWASLLKGTTIRVDVSENYAQASAISRKIAIDLSVFWDAPDAALAFTIAHELGHIALEHGAGTDDESADYNTQLRLAAQYRQGELDADEFAVRLCKTLGYNKAEVFKFIAQNEAELQMFNALTQSPTSSHPSHKTRIERARMNGFQLSKGGIEQMNVLKQHLAEDDTEHRNIVNRLSRELKLFEEQDNLFEITMSPSSLKKLSAQTGALAGMEFEMCVPGAGDNDDGDQEPDYEYDERCRSIQDARDFFYDGNFNSRRDIENMSDRMQNDYAEWLYERIDRDFVNESEYLISEWIANNVDESEWNPDDLEGEARQEALDEFISNVDADPNNDYYQKVLDEYREENQDSYDESDWLDAEDLDLMSYVENAYDVTWPHWRGTGGGEASIEDVADSFRDAVGRPILASTSYHSGRVERPSTKNLEYIVEPDSSIDVDDNNDQGLEFVSPPLPIEELLNDLNKVKAWADRTGCYTNDSTGLHINVSVPGWTGGTDQLDYVKLALLLGDEFVLDSFGRAGNTYAKSAMGKIRDAVRKSPDRAQELMDKMKSGMDQLASKVVHSRSTDKYTSINVKDGYIEFRSPGGDWLNDNFAEIDNTLRRFTVALSAAVDPEAYRQEYLKKLYKLLDISNEKDPLSYFAKYAAGELPQAALKSFVRQAQLERSVKRGKETGPMVWKVSNPPQSLASIEVVANSKEEAIKRATAPDGYPAWANTIKSVVAEPLRPYKEKPAQQPQPQPQPPQAYEVYDSNTGATVYQFTAADDAAATQDGLEDYRTMGPHSLPPQQAAQRYLLRRAGTTPRPDIIDIEPDVEQNFVPGSTQDIQQRRAAGGEFTGAWQIVDSNGNELHRFSGIGNAQADANRVAAGWLARAGYQAGIEVAVVPVLSEGQDRYGNFDPPGPESPPKMPAGTIKVDVSDMYDWYKLGQNISDLKSIDKSTLGKGPPSTVFAFGSEDLENMYSHELTKLGLKTHDLDEPGEEDVDEQIVNELKINNATGIGAVPHNADVDYHGLRVTMRPSMFLRLALPLDRNDSEERKAIEYCKSQLDDPGIGAPFLTITMPEAWESDDFSLEAKVRDHDGRHRCYAILDKENDEPIEVHLFVSGMRRRHISDSMIKNLRNGILNQQGQYVSGPVFDTAQ